MDCLKSFKRRFIDLTTGKYRLGIWINIYFGIFILLVLAVMGYMVIRNISDIYVKNSIYTTSNLIIIPINKITEDISKVAFNIIALIASILIVVLVFTGFVTAKVYRLFHKMVDDKTNQLQLALEDLKKTQEQLVASEKMASLGSLVAGVSHEINTPIGISVTAATHLQDKTVQFIEKIREDSLRKADLISFCGTAEEMTSILSQNLKRASDLIKSFKQIAIDQSYEDIREINLKVYIEEIILNLKHMLKKSNVNIEIKDEMKISTLKTYGGALAQIFTNLIMNSINHGYETLDKGTINIILKDDEKKISVNYIDDGIGMSKETLKKIFDPFFTTKRGRGGSGLGMYIVYNIVTNNLEGSIECKSEPGKGTSFNMVFPRTLKNKQFSAEE